MAATNALTLATTAAFALFAVGSNGQVIKSKTKTSGLVLVDNHPPKCKLHLPEEGKDAVDKFGQKTGAKIEGRLYLEAVYLKCSGAEKGLFLRKEHTGHPFKAFPQTADNVDQAQEYYPLFVGSPEITDTSVIFKWSLRLNSANHAGAGTTKLTFDKGTKMLSFKTSDITATEMNSNGPGWDFNDIKQAVGESFLKLMSCANKAALVADSCAP